MENNKSEFEVTGAYFDASKGVFDLYEIQVSQSGDAARYRFTTKLHGSKIVTKGRWQKIRYSKRCSHGYITMYGKRLYIYKFIRVY